MKAFSTYIIVVITIVALTACIGFFAKKRQVRQSAPETAPITVETSVISPPMESSLPYSAPSFQDGDYYIEAVSTRNMETCKKILNQSLKARCTTDSSVAPQQ